MTPLKTINYAFPSSGLSASAAAQHAVFARERLAEYFGLSPEVVRVKHSERLPGDVPMMLTCYTGTSKTDNEAMIVAAKLVLPHLRESQERCSGALSEDWADWLPGSDIDADERFLGYITAGFDAHATTGQTAWLRQKSHQSLGKPSDTLEQLPPPVLAGLLLKAWEQQKRSLLGL